MRTEWIAVDWGTTHLRAWAMNGDKAIAFAGSDQGMARLTSGAFETTLLSVISDWLGSEPIDVIACGMVGARQGWHEVPYVQVPTKPGAIVPLLIGTKSDRFRLQILPGLSQAQPADVMRGEETQIAGFLALNPGWDGVVCLPGTHTKWVHISADEVVSFQTFMTGELFDLLSTASVLRHSVDEGWEDAAFEDALDSTLSRPERLAAQLFTVRAEDLLNGIVPGQARAKLSGLLIGAELAAARPYWLGQQVAVLGDPELCSVYAKGLERQGVPTQILDATDMTLAGLGAVRSQVEAGV